MCFVIVKEILLLLCYVDLNLKRALIHYSLNQGNEINTVMHVL